MVENGQALMLTRDDFPPESAAYRKWEKVGTMHGAFGAAKKYGLRVAVRQGAIYLYRSG
jgi:hypothetical protein